MKKQATIGGAVGLVLVGAYFLGNLFTGGWGLGPGSGRGTGDGKNTSANEIVNSTTEPPTTPVNITEPPGVELGKVLSVLIDGTEYRVLKSPEANSLEPGNYRPATLEQIVELAQQVEGDSGIKVRIAMRGNSDPAAEQQLKNALIESNIPADALYEVETTIP